MRRTIAEGEVHAARVLGVCSRHDTAWWEHARATIRSVDMVVLRRRMIPSYPGGPDIGEALPAKIVHVDGQAISQSFIGGGDVRARLERICSWG